METVESKLRFPQFPQPLLTRLLAHVTDRTARELIISFGDLHVYKNHRSQVEELLSREPYPLPTLTIEDSGDPSTQCSVTNRGLEGVTRHAIRKLETQQLSMSPEDSRYRRRRGLCLKSCIMSRFMKQKRFFPKSPFFLNTSADLSASF